MKSPTSRLNRVVASLLGALVIVAARVLVHLYLPAAHWEAAPCFGTAGLRLYLAAPAWPVWPAVFSLIGLAAGLPGLREVDGGRRVSRYE